MYFYFIVACIPIIWMIISLSKLKMSAYKSCPIAFIITFILSIFIWKMNIIEAVTATIEGIALAIWPIIITIIGAIFIYNLSVYTGSMEVIKKLLINVTSDKRILVLILSYGFGGFLEAISGFGTAVTIPASILLALGFEPTFAAIICLISNTTSTAFGAIGIPVMTLADVTGLEVNYLSYIISLQLFMLTVLMPFILVFIVGKTVKAIKGIFGITLACGIGFAIPQVIIAKYIGPQLVGIIGGAVSMIITIFIANKYYKKNKNLIYEIEDYNKYEKISLKEAMIAWLPFILLVVIIIISSPLFSFINNPLYTIKTSVQIYRGIGSKPFTFLWIVNPGTLIILSTYISGLIQKVELRKINMIFYNTIKQMIKPSITIISIISLAKIMGYSGMIKAIADIVVAITGSFYPLISPLIGAIGTFITGSDTSSNILFGNLQIEAANAIGINSYWLAGSNTLGATGGKMISPQSIAVAVTATNIMGYEGKILNYTLKICLIYVVISGIIVYLLKIFFI